MARDYKHRVQNPSYGSNRTRHKKPPSMWWRWLLVAVLIVTFVVFLNMVRSMVAELMAGKPDAEFSEPKVPVVKQEIPLDQKKPAVGEPEKPVEPEPMQPEEPRYDFYTILPQAETVVPDYEIQTRVREQLVGKTKLAKYVMQAGSFRQAEDAERHKAKLALLGIESWVEKAKVGNVIWHRVKIGPYDNPSSVSTIKALLQKNGIGVIVTEQGK
ncbi:SPOR domain-containing protein [Methylomonas methanica]|uniref:Sporulation domain-containing protein n=1 Tax=Methylomonas methanica (strain DSM 25384 / MC09) TaxID=857087 RepID=G0A5S0_METMM|nr:SPOR domain-containing protein [Methylomonas methanica]AEG02927.1 Sporulation domain-containing protein [Methylomonas methanica MC09]